MAGMVKQGSVEQPEEAALPEQADYPSALFGQFCKHISELNSGVGILDLGPSTPGNVMYWIEHGHRVSALDLV
ncbi:MAG: hypothetical protein ACE5JX_22110, partial [Acidobacteriota bacterium]